MCINYEHNSSHRHRRWNCCINCEARFLCLLDALSSRSSSRLATLPVSLYTENEGPDGWEKQLSTYFDNRGHTVIYDCAHIYDLKTIRDIIWFKRSNISARTVEGIVWRYDFPRHSVPSLVALAQIAEWTLSFHDEINVANNFNAERPKIRRQLPGAGLRNFCKRPAAPSVVVSVSFGGGSGRRVRFI